MGPVGRVVAVLHRDDPRYRAGFGELIDRNVGQPDVADLASQLQLHESAHAVGERHPRIGRVQLEQLEAVQAQPPQTQFALPRELFRPSRRR